MGSCGRSSLSFFIASRPFHLRQQSSDRLLPSLGLTHLNLKRRLSLSITSFSTKILSPPPPPLSDKDKRSNALPRGAGEGVKEDARSKLLQVVLVSPQIPGNTGCIARTCAASAVGLHLVGPLGFQVDDAKVKRAGLDYWPFVVVKAHSSWAEFQEYFRKQEGEKRMIAFTKRGTKIHSEFSYRRGDYLLFGSETSGLPPEALSDCKSELYGGGTIRIPMVETYVRCLNLSVSVGVAVYEASRQLNYEQIECAPEGDSVNDGFNESHLINTGAILEGAISRPYVCVPYTNILMPPHNNILIILPATKMYRVLSKLSSSIGSSTSRKLVSGRIISSRNYVAKDISFGVGARAAMLQGVSEVAEAVKVTMGPKGRNVIIESSYGAPKITKDGVTVAKSISFESKAKNMGAELVKQVANATNKVAGDGTTCATVLTQAILTEGCKSVAAGVNVMDLRSGINMAIDAVVSDLKSRAVMISTPEEITQVATISANGEREIGELIARAMEKVGKEGVITVADGNTLENELEVVEGMKLARGYISPYFITDEKTQKCELENPIILIHEKKVSDMNSLLKVLEAAVKSSRPLLVVAEDVESDALAMLILNKHHAGLKVCAIKAPGFGDNRKASLDDLAVLTGAEVISEERGLTLDKIRPELLGTAKKVTISRDDTLILHGGGDKKLIEERCEELRSANEKSTSTFDKEKTQERLSKLSGGVAVFKVGGASEAEVGERKDRVTDALNATRAAVEEGIIPGGGVALLYATKALDNLETQNEDQRRGVQIVQNALKAPALTIAANAGYDGSLVVGKLLEQDDCNFGFDASKGGSSYVDMVKAGIIDPVKVIKTALTDAASVSLLLTTTEASVLVKAEEKTQKHVPDMAGMGM
ncbi:hypothetical protein HID58_043969 [Brassica napus]|uniref:tRNA/rRNA methyltransferase SpoU type domain-containing protein n=1 Tax=Brassica napus TaxID=3708 RepID=A0ABQ8AFM0_BRANA|nr:hypothetical protein HID58_053768 [Brassica napus]KAH0904466.1 hypothetical protein HID58_043969 [Brassica napus]